RDDPPRRSGGGRVVQPRLLHVVSVGILSTVHDPDDLDAIRQRDIENHVTVDWKAAKVRAQFPPLPSGQRVLRQHLENLTDTPDLLLGSPNAVRGNKIPNRIEIDVCL